MFSFFFFSFFLFSGFAHNSWQKTTRDVFYGSENLSKMCGRFSMALLSCPSVLMSLNGLMPGNENTPCPPTGTFYRLRNPSHKTTLVGCLHRPLPPRKI